MKVRTWLVMVSMVALEASCSLFQAPLAPPTGLQVTKDGAGFLSLGWRNNEPAAEGFTVEYMEPGLDTWSASGRLGSSANRWGGTKVALDGQYTFRVKVHRGGESATSDSIAFFNGTSNWDNNGWAMMWSDEFNQGSLDVGNWTVETGSGGWGNNELQYYRTQNVGFIDEGDTSALRITARVENFGGSAYTSARMKTQSLRTFRYGRIEARLRLPGGQGIWPAFWMLGQSIGTVGWPACGEIDIMEMVGGTASGKSDSTTYGTIHWKNAAGAREYTGSNTSLSNGRFSDTWHMFGIEWDSGSISWYLDGVKFFEQSITQADRSEFKEDFFLLLNLAVGGDWPGNPDASTVFPQYYDVDWVRVFQKN